MLESETLQRAVSGRVDMTNADRPFASVMTAYDTSGNREENRDGDGDAVLDEGVDETVVPNLGPFFLILKPNDAQILREGLLLLLDSVSPFHRLSRRWAGYGTLDRVGERRASREDQFAIRPSSGAHPASLMVSDFSNKQEKLIN